MAGSEVHVSFAASSQTHSVQPIMPNCQFNKLTSVFLCVCPLIDDKLRHNIVKVVMEPRAAVYVLGHQHVLGSSQESELGPKHVYAREHKLYCFIKLKHHVKSLIHYVNGIFVQCYLARKRNGLIITSLIC